MPLRPKTRRRLMWVCTVLTVLLLVPWAGSFWVTPSRLYIVNASTVCSITIHRGTFIFCVGIDTDPAKPFGLSAGSQLIASLGWRRITMDPEWPRWLFRFNERTTVNTLTLTESFIPLTPILAAMLPITGWLWWKELRTWLRQPWQCAKCGYDRRGLAAPSTPCPECSTAPAAA